MRALPDFSNPLLLPTVWDILAPTIPRAIRHIIVLALLGLVLMLVSCGPRSGHVPVYPVRGQVYFQGKPASHAFVALHPCDQTNAAVPHPTAYTDAEGRFALSTYAPQDGAPAGEYVVTIVWWAPDAIKDPQEGDELTQLNRLPPRYGDPKSSGLQARITQETNELIFRLGR
jgi:hypothetical protein